MRFSLIFKGYLSAKLITYNSTILSFDLKGRDKIMDYEQIAKYAFLVFGIIAIVMGLVVGYMAYNATLHWYDSSVADINGYVMLIMLILGIIIGLISVTAKEVTPFLIAAIALIVTGVSTNVWSPLSRIHDLLYYWATAILNYFVAFAAPAAVIIAAKSIWAIAKEK